VKIASHEGDWEHVSVTDQSTKRSQERTPSWEMMTRIKRAFWDDEECVGYLRARGNGAEEKGIGLFLLLAKGRESKADCQSYKGE
jgi:hypothetical protein